MSDALRDPFEGLIVGEAAAEAELRRWTRIGILILLLTFGLTVAWSCLAPLASAVVAPAIVKVDSNRKKIQHQEGGVIKEVLVRDGDRVKAGDVLVRLDETRAGAPLNRVCATTAEATRPLHQLAKVRASPCHRPT